MVLDNGSRLKVAASWSADQLDGDNAVATRRRSAERFVHTEVDEALARGTAKLAVQRPLVKGFLQDVPLQTEVWEHALGANDNGAALLVTSPPGSLPESIHALVDMALRYFGFARVNVTTPQLLTLMQYTARPKDFTVVEGSDAEAQCLPLHAVVVDMGASASNVVVFVDGDVVKPAYRRVPVGGHAVQIQVQMFLNRRHPTIEVPSMVSTAITERCCYVAKNFLKEAKEGKDLSKIIYGLPGHGTFEGKGYVVPKEMQREVQKKARGQFVTVCGERFAAPEALFTPAIQGFGAKSGGIADAVLEAINAAGVSHKSALAGNILVTGGVSLTPGFTERLLQEVRSRLPAHIPVAVKHCTEAAIGPARGGKEFFGGNVAVRSLLDNAAIERAEWKGVYGERDAWEAKIRRVWRASEVLPEGHGE